LADVSEPLADVSEPLADVSEPLADVSEPLADVSEPLADVSEPLVDLSEPLADVSEPFSYLSEPFVALLKSPPSIGGQAFSYCPFERSELGVVRPRRIAGPERPPNSVISLLYRISWRHYRTRREYR